MKKYLPLLLVICGCAAHPIHPGTANAFDSSTYDTLTITDSVIQSTKADLSAGKFPASIAQNVKTALNILITSYDVLDMAYCGTPVAGVGSGSLQCAATPVQRKTEDVHERTSRLPQNPNPMGMGILSTAVPLRVAVQRAWGDDAALRECPVHGIDDSGAEQSGRRARMRGRVLMWRNLSGDGTSGSFFLDEYVQRGRVCDSSVGWTRGGNRCGRNV